MFRRLFFDEPQMPGPFARAMHSNWLTRALRSGMDLPRIPTRRVSDGGFDLAMTTEQGRAWAEAFWSGVFETLEAE